MLPTRAVRDRFDFAKHPRAINIFMISAPLIFMTLAQITSNIASNHYNNIFATYRAVTVQISLAIASIQAGMVPTNVVKIEEMVAYINSETVPFLSWWRSLWIISAFFVSLEGSIFAIGAHAYFSTLSESIAVRSPVLPFITHENH